MGDPQADVPDDHHAEVRQPDPALPHRRLPDPADRDPLREEQDPDQRDVDHHERGFLEEEEREPEGTCRDQNPLARRSLDVSQIRVQAEEVAERRREALQAGRPPLQRAHEQHRQAERASHQQWHPLRIEQQPQHPVEHVDRRSERDQLDPEPPMPAERHQMNLQREREAICEPEVLEQVREQPPPAKAVRMGDDQVQVVVEEPAVMPQRQATSDCHDGDHEA